MLEVQVGWYSGSRVPARLGVEGLIADKLFRIHKITRLRF